MRNKRRVFEIYSFFDYDGIEKRLEKMSEKGWLFEKIGPLWWTYRRVEPKKRSFFISYFPKASEFDPYPSEEQEEFIDFCRRTGWRPAGRSAQMQVFFNEAEDPIPIETDPALEVETIHKAAKRSYIPIHLIMLLIAAYQCVYFLSQLRSNPVRFLYRVSNMYTSAMYLMLLMLCAVELCAYFLWRARALRASQMGERVPSASHRLFQKVVFSIIGLLFAAYLLDVFFGGDELMKIVMAWTLVYAIALIFISNGVKAWLKRLGKPRGVTRALTLTATVIAAFGLFGLIIHGGRRLNESGVLDREDFTPPVGISDMYGEREGEYREFSRFEQSPLISYISVDIMPVGGGGKLPSLSYTVTRAKLPPLMDLIRSEALNSRQDEIEDGAVVFVDHYEAVDAAPWQAREAYRLYWSTGYLNTWLLIYDDRAVEVDFGNSSPEPEQMRLTAEKLGEEIYEG